MSNNQKELPAQGNYFSVCSARIRELKSIENKLKLCKHGARAYQCLPRHMIRRALSSNPRRLPKSIRDKHKKELNNKIKVPKRPSRKYRRRPSNLVAEYNRRQRNKRWLETHIWHAKRFHMIEKWGYKLPLKPTTKSYRSSIRAALHTCLLQDVSYESTFELEGKLEAVLLKLKNVLSSEDIRKLSNDGFLAGSLWIDATFYHPNSLPFKCIGSSQMLCIPNYNNKEIIKLWIMVHPSIHDEIFELFCLIFELNDDQSELNRSNASESKETSEIPNFEREKIVNYNIESPKVFKSLHFRLIILKDKLIKFRLTGNLSYEIMNRVLLQSDVTYSSKVNFEKLSSSELKKEKFMTIKQEEKGLNSEDTDNNLRISESLKISKSDLDEELLEEQSSGNSNDQSFTKHWWINFSSNPENRENNDAQVNIWNSLFDSVNFKKRVISLVVRDPRVILPKKKETIVNLKENFSRNRTSTESIASNVGINAYHPIFCEKIREAVSNTQVPTHMINQKRSQILVPGSQLPLDDEESRLPVLLLQRIGDHARNVGHGWDIIMPPRWGTPTLVAFALNGAVIGGQEQEKVLNSELLIRPNSHMSPDTFSGKVYASLEEKNNRDNYFKRPPAARLNYIKLGVQFPFTINWMQLIKFWSEGSEDIFVVRDKDVLKFLSILTCNKLLKISAKENEYEDSENFRKIKKQKTNNCSETKTLNKIKKFTEIPYINSSLLYVRIILLGKGNLEPFSMIYLPTIDDLNYFIFGSKANKCETSDHDAELVDLNHRQEKLIVDSKTDIIGSKNNIIDSKNKFNLVEKTHEDKNVELREKLRKENVKVINTLRRKRKKARQDVLNRDNSDRETDVHTEQRLAVKEMEEKNQDMIELVKNYSEKMNNLWLRDEKESFQCNMRKIFGFSVQGGFCIQLGRSASLSYVATKPFLEYLSQLEHLKLELENRQFEINKKMESQNYEIKNETLENNSKISKTIPKQVFVLVRNSSSFQYRWARIVVLNI